MVTLLNDTRKFEKINLKNDGILILAVNQEKYVDNIFKNLVVFNSISEEASRSLMPVGTRPSMDFVHFTNMSPIIGHLFYLFFQ